MAEQPEKQEIANAYGAVDLANLGGANPTASSTESANPNNANAGQDGKALPGIGSVPVTEGEFQQVAQLSKQVPVVLVFVDEDPISKQALAVLEAAEKQANRRFLLGKVEGANNPRLIQAFGIKDYPTVFALVNERPVPLYAGSPEPQQVEQVLMQLLQMCEQNGINGQVQAPDDQEIAKEPEEYAEPKRLAEAGDLAGALAAWEHVVTVRPQDQEAKRQLAGAKLALRAASESEDPLAQIDERFKSGQIDDAFNELLNLVATQDEPLKSAAKDRLVEYFTILGAGDARVKNARARLASLLF
ncbi:hypothetical protein BSR28_07945 [Boudabousia liubingyangii]|uniref:tetratricopeptide repeat protein n=1 Tax=Boudabousia liubingyangii TaxID=1921764 RepID=UPI00093CBD1A|nr:tetratricopeptide repeat protein [Boudabousia liubingyangii]OKL46445.1 hypothetical protein BSR28_07945 [Boudabousia liubingyangii]